MTVKTYVNHDQFGNIVGYGYNDSQSNKLPNGRVDRRVQSPHLYTKRQARVRGGGEGGAYYPVAPDAGSPVIYYFPDPYARLEQVALSRFNGRLKNGSASLGVTLASWRQSREMITHRLSSANAVLTAAELQFRRASKKELKAVRKRLSPDSLASKVLETEFGWRPLFQDIHAGMKTVCGEHAIPPAWVVGRARAPFHSEVYEPGIPPWTVPNFQSIDATLLVTVAANVAISNPNLWLLNRLGLINPAVVAWDLIPWSFLVNMFVNVNQVLESFTAYVGLEISDKSITKSSIASRNSRLGPTTYQDYVYAGNSTSLTIERQRLRTIGTLPTRSLTVRVPELNWELALIASSLAVQRVTKINKILFS